MYTKKDLILILYACGQIDWAMGRHECYAEQYWDGKRTNLLGKSKDNEDLNAVA